MLKIDTTSIPKNYRNTLPAGVWHVVLTRHNIHNLFNGGSNQANAADDAEENKSGLSSQQIELRSLIFEMCGVPSLCAQTNRNFDLIVVTSKGEHNEHLRRIQAMVGQEIRLHVHMYAPDEDLSRCAWLSKYAPENTTHIITTNLDDDDALPSTFIEAIQSKVLACSTDFPPMMTFGSKSTLQWELMSTRQAPLGYRSEWHLGDWARSPGHSLFTRYESSSPSVLALTHVLCDVWFEESNGEKLLARLSEIFGPASEPYLAGFAKELHEFRRQYLRLIQQAIEWKDRRGGELFFELGGETGPAVMTNHFCNVSLRLVHSKRERVPVLGAQSFPGTALRFDVFQNNTRIFGSRRWSDYLRLWTESFRLRASESVLNRICAALRDAWRVARL